MSELPSGGANPSPWLDWTHEAAATVIMDNMRQLIRHRLRAGTRYIIVPSRPSEDRWGPRIQRIFLPGEPSERTFGIGYTYECDVDMLAEPNMAGPQKLTETSDSPRQTKTNPNE